MTSALHISTSPYVHEPLSTQRIMKEVVVALAFPAIASIYFFGAAAIWVLSVACVSTMLTEWILGRKDERSLQNFSALLTGLVFGLTLPPGLSLWMVALGGFMSIALGKYIWGGLGHNLFNPALVGRAFLQAAFPVALTTWSPNQVASGALSSFWQLPPSTLALPLMRAETVDGLTQATPLGLMKFEAQITGTWDLLMGSTGGSLGETSALVLILCGAVLAWRRIFDWRLPAATLLSVGTLSGALFLIDSARYPSPIFMLLSGGLLYGAVFMLTDPVTSPITPRGAWVFGLGVGVLVVLIRLFGGLAEGVMYAVLLMNAVTPLINRYTQPRPFGG